MKKLPPHSEEAEFAVLGSMMMEPEYVVGKCILKPLTHDSFFIPAHKIIYDAMVRMDKAGTKIDPTTITDFLRKEGTLDKVSGWGYISGIIDRTPTAAHADHYIDVVFQTHLARAGISAYEEGIDRLYGPGHPTEAFSTVQGNVEKLMKSGVTFRNTDEVNKSIIESWDKPGVLSRHIALNLIMRYDGMVVLGGRPSCGKTAFILNETGHWCEKGMTVCGASIEMSEEKIRERLAGSYSSVNTFRVWRGDASADERQRMIDALEHMKTWKLHINDSSMTCAQFCAWARTMKSLVKPDVIWMDYLQLLRCADEDWRIQPEQRIARWSNEIKAAQKEIGIPIVVLSQLSRAGDGDVPMLGSLRYSGAIEQDADVVMFVYKDPDASPDAFRGAGDWPEYLDVQKQRNGGTDRVKMTFHRDLQTFSSENPLDILEKTDNTAPVHKEGTAATMRDFEW